MLETQAVETIDAVFSTYFLFHVFLCFLLPTPAPHLSARHDLHKYQTIPLNICQENSWDPWDITISRFRIYTVFMSVLHELFLHVTLRPASRVRGRRVVPDVGSGVCVTPAEKPVLGAVSKEPAGALRLTKAAFQIVLVWGESRRVNTAAAHFTPPLHSAACSNENYSFG